MFQSYRSENSEVLLGKVAQQSHVQLPHNITSQWHCTASNTGEFVDLRNHVDGGVR